MTVDCLGLACPIPVVRLVKAVASVEVGALVELLADDPGAKVDIPVWCRLKDQQLVAQHTAPKAAGCSRSAGPTSAGAAVAGWEEYTDPRLVALYDLWGPLPARPRVLHQGWQWSCRRRRSPTSAAAPGCWPASWPGGTAW